MGRVRDVQDAEVKTPALPIQRCCKGACSTTKETLHSPKTTITLDKKTLTILASHKISRKIHSTEIQRLNPPELTITSIQANIIQILVFFNAIMSST